MPVDVWKKSIAAASSKDGELDTSTTTSAPANASASPSPVSVLTPVLGEAGDDVVAVLAELADELGADEAVCRR